MSVCSCTGATDHDMLEGTERGRRAGKGCGGCEAVVEALLKDARERDPLRVVDIRAPRSALPPCAVCGRDMGPNFHFGHVARRCGACTGWAERTGRALGGCKDCGVNPRAGWSKLCGCCLANSLGA